MSINEVTALLNQAADGDKQVLNEAYALLYAEIKSIAGFQLKRLNTGQTITPTVLANECYLKLYQAENISIKNKRHFLNCLSQSMRQFLIDTLRAKSSQKRQSLKQNSNLTDVIGDDDISFKLLEIDLILEKITVIDPKLAEILHHKLIFNMTFNEIAEVLQLSERQVMRLWKQAKALLLAIFENHPG